MTQSGLEQVPNPDQMPGVRAQSLRKKGVNRVNGILDAAAACVDEVGVQNLTTAIVAEKAGASIGSLYRYFPDRHGLVQALRDRAVLRYRAAVMEKLSLQVPSTWQAAVSLGIDALVDMFRHEPGFSVVRFIDVNRRDADSVRFSASYFATMFAYMLSSNFGLPAGETLVFRLEVAVEMGLALIERAFLHSSQGDPALIAETHRAVLLYLNSVSSEPVPPLGTAAERS